MANNQNEIGPRNTANIVFDGYDHKDVCVAWEGMGSGSKYFANGLPSYINQIYVFDEEGIMHRAWHKVYDSGLLTEDPYFWLATKFYFYPDIGEDKYLTGFIFPVYKNFTYNSIKGDWTIIGSRFHSVNAGMVVTKAREYAGGRSAYEDSYTNQNTYETIRLDAKKAFLGISVTTNGTDWYSTTKFKRYDNVLGKKAREVYPIIIVKEGMFLFHEREFEPGDNNYKGSNDERIWISYMDFNTKTKEFGDPKYFKLCIQNLFNLKYSTSFSTSSYFAIDHYVFIWNVEHINPDNTNYTFQSRVHFVRIDPDGNVKHFYTRWYYTIEMERPLTVRHDKAYFCVDTVNVYVSDNTCPKMTSIMTVDKDGNISFIYSESYIFLGFDYYNRMQQSVNKVGTICHSPISVCKNDHSDWWYIYKDVYFSSNAFPKSGGGYYDKRVMLARTTDFIHFEFYETPDEPIEYEDQEKRTKIKVCYSDPLMANDVYRASLEPYFTESFCSTNSGNESLCFKDNKLSDTSGHFIMALGNSAEVHPLQGTIYVKNYACMKKDGDVRFIYRYYADNKYQYLDQTILNQICGLDYPGKDD